MKLLKSLLYILLFSFFSVNAQLIKEIQIYAPKPYFSVVKNEKLDAATDHLIGMQINPTTLNNLIESVTKLYRGHGFMGCQAFIPEQDASDGTIKVAVDNLRLRLPRIENESSIKFTTVYELLIPAIKNPDNNITDTKINDYLLQVRDIGAFDVEARFTPVTQADIDADPILRPDLSYYKGSFVAKDTKTFFFNSFVDNYGEKNTGKGRLTAIVNSNNLTNHIDKGLFAINTTTKGYTNGLAEYSFHIGERFKFLGLSLNYGSYDLKDEYSDLKVKGKQSYLDLFYKDSLFRDSFTKVEYKLGASYRSLKDSFEDFDIDLKRKNTAIYTQFFTDYVNYEKTILFSNDTKFSIAKTSNQDEFNLYETKPYALLNTQSSLSYFLSRNVSIDTKLNLQLSSGYIDPSDKMNAGGAYAVKAYQGNLASGDMGLFNSIGSTYYFYGPLNLSVGSSFMQSHIRNFKGKAESFYGLELNAHVDYKGFYSDFSLAKAVGKHQKLAEDKLSALIQFGYNY